MTRPCRCDSSTAEYLTELCQALVSRAGHSEVYDTEPRSEYLCLFEGQCQGRPHLLTSPDQFCMFSPAGNDACVQAFHFVTERPHLVDLFGLNRQLFDQLKAGIVSGSIRLPHHDPPQVPGGEPDDPSR